jgi:large subunit ribosomal protein L23
MRSLEQVLVRPVVSEKSYSLSEKGAYVFLVAPEATKVEVRQAVEQIFGVQVAKVNTMNRRGKRIRSRRFATNGTYGNRASTKRAVVTLAGDDRIDLFERS